MFIQILKCISGKLSRLFSNLKKATTHADDRVKQSIEMSRHFLKYQN
ncbi:hypothetical protein LC2W_2231 [Lacticaseibacillus paracasei]|uniref:Uncharacterized protein n=1 Tax=Lacticaseibacillus paracasei subsp. paracasei TaxID=47714 RepID=A0AAP9HIT7_LACPA|nr:hypothetical protein LC2W_2231 [Lacticaseibacillus paracasei]EPC34623.1 hypothetical protein Lpp223_1025 [Lacticaseibacillus paracasei subsp. paracasei Lpp223]QGV18790.1 Hypothetical protein LCAKO_2282 [Lacticaseibacillus paracasei subsp. paracasei]